MSFAQAKINMVKTWDLAYVPMEPHSLAKWLEGEMESRREEGENEKGCANKIAINELRLPEDIDQWGGTRDQRSPARGV